MLDLDSTLPSLLVGTSLPEALHLLPTEVIPVKLSKHQLLSNNHTRPKHHSERHSEQSPAS